MHSFSLKSFNGNMGLKYPPPKDKTYFWNIYLIYNSVYIENGYKKSNLVQLPTLFALVLNKRFESRFIFWSESIQHQKPISLDYAQPSADSRRIVPTSTIVQNQNAESYVDY